MPEVVVTLLFAVPTDHSLFVDLDVANYSREITIGDNTGRIEFPGESAPAKTRKISLSAPLSAPPAFAEFLEHKFWGLKQERMSYAEVEAVLLAFPAATELQRPIGDIQVAANAVSHIVPAVWDWFESFVHWVWVITGQSLDPINPDPKTQHRRSLDMLVAFSHEGEFSQINTVRPNHPLRLDLHDPTAERLVTRQVLDLVLARAGHKSPPIMWEMLASSRMAARRQDSRRALIDAGTAAEAAISILLALPSDHSFTLGNLVGQAERKPIPIPSDARDLLVGPRNNAVHRGQASPERVNRAIEIAEALVVQADESFIPASALPMVNRPQVDQLRFIRPRREP